jgi:hypothetical protein
MTAECVATPNRSPIAASLITQVAVLQSTAISFFFSTRFTIV